MSYAFFLGCLIPLRYPGIESTTRALFSRLGVGLEDLKGASCCPAPGVTRSFDRMTWLTLGARNLALAEKVGSDILTACNGCFGSLSGVAKELRDPTTRMKVNRHLSGTGSSYKGVVGVRHLIEVLHQDIGLAAIRECVTNPLDTKVSVHLGCHFREPLGNNRPGVDATAMLDELVMATGATCLDHPQ